MSEPRKLQDRVASAFERSAARADSRAYTGGDLLASIHDALGDITLCRSLEGVIRSSNHTFREFAGAPQPEGRTCAELGITFEAGPIPHCYDVEFTRDGRTRIFLWHDVVTRDAVVGGLVVQSIARDVTDERREAARREEARARAEEESLLKSRLIATVSHEIRTPLSGLLGMGQLLAGTRLTAEQKNYLEGIRQSGTALVQLVEDLLDFSTLAAGRFHLRPRLEPIRPLVESVVEMLSSRAHAKGIEIGAIISPDVPALLEFDPARFRQVLYNVIGNAVKFTETGGVLVSVDRADGALVVKVRDSGPGMNAAELQRIFGEFEQGDLTRAREGGVGLGLAISARIMTEAGGALGVESEFGKGSTFTIRLPVDFSGPPMRSGSELAGSHVLLLAPEGPAADAISYSLNRLGATVRTASDMAGTRAALDGQAFTDVIVDHRLDTDFAQAFARDARLAQTRKIFLVNPEARPEQMSGDVYDSWLIRPLREQSLIDVLTGRLSGLEPRMAKDKDFPVLAPEPQQERRPVAHSGLSVIFGEDEPVNAMIVRAILERAGHTVRHANSFTQLEVLRRQGAHDLILTDNDMPGGTCDAFIDSLRVEEVERGVAPARVIVLTANDAADIHTLLLKKGADLVLLKPATPEMLASAIDALAVKRSA
ncbi:hybrid sensor histidine kinase/response regulator [Rhizobium sp. LjRoot254]|uniref:ATP-binding response regulator n=1 Tax=Rhizobium sp. LjRoot254 TaxID=3342297 RepID=UPI003ECF025D